MASSAAVETGVSLALTQMLAYLGKPETDPQIAATKAFDAAEYDQVRRLGTTNLDDCYIKALVYLCSANKKPLPPTINVILAEAARAIAEHRKQTALRELSQMLANSLD